MSITVDVTMPLRLVSEANQREHWRKRAVRASNQRAVTRMRLAVEPHWPVPLPCVVTLTRIGPRTLDGDNLQSAFKATRDGVADALGVDDGDEAVTWRYEQCNGAYAVEIRVEHCGDDNRLRRVPLHERRRRA